MILCSVCIARLKSSKIEIAFKISVESSAFAQLKKTEHQIERKMSTNFMVINKAACFVTETTYNRIPILNFV